MATPFFDLFECGHDAGEMESVLTGAMVLDCVVSRTDASMELTLQVGTPAPPVLLQMMEQEYGVKPLIMTTQEGYLKYFSLERYGAYHVVTISNGLKFPATRYTFWQYTDKEQVAGIVEYVPGWKLHLTYKLDNVRL